jgi:xanthine dehydrogenase small subunit
MAGESSGEASSTDVSTTDFVANGRNVTVSGTGSLLDSLRDELGFRSVKDGCSPQGQCGCCTVWVDGKPRVACVTPVARVAGREVTTIEGLADAQDWADAFCESGGSQCGFCTPGIIMRAAALEPEQRLSSQAVGNSMLAHLCRCTGWHPIVEAIAAVGSPRRGARRDTALAEQRALLEGGVAQSVDPSVALGQGGFSDDSAPADALVAVRAADGSWVVADTLDGARELSGKIQGRRTTAPLTWPVDVPEGEWDRTLQTTWVEPGYLEVDATWCEPGGEPMSLHGNGGAFGGKMSTELGETVRRLADHHGRPVRLLGTREDVVHFGPKRPPIAAGVRSDGTGVIRVVATPGIASRISVVAPGLDVIQVSAAGPPTSAAVRAAGWAEAAVLLASVTGSPEYVISSPAGATAAAAIGDDGAISIRVTCGRPLDEIVLRSYCVGAAHMALGWVTSEGLSVDADGVPHDLTIRSFGILRAIDTPPIHVEIDNDDRDPVNGSDAVFAAVAAAAWSRTDWALRWPAAR